jgi:hypothetical protein
MIEMRYDRGGIFTRSGLKELTEDLKPDLIMAEVGVYAGESTRIFLDSGKISEYYAIDPWLPFYDMKEEHEVISKVLEAEKLFDNAMSCWNNVHKLKMTSEEASATFKDRSLDLVYLDGLHGYKEVKRDIQIWFPKIKPGGYIGGHDYSKAEDINYNGVIPAVDEYFAGKTLKFYRDTSWLYEVP